MHHICYYSFNYLSNVCLRHVRLVTLMIYKCAKMVEFCSVKRMGVLVAALVVVCIIFLGVENALTDDYKSSNQSNLTGKEFCWRRENFSIKQECSECSDFEKISGHSVACSSTGFKELVVCIQSGEVYRSCPRSTWLERRNFWIFESSLFVVGLVSWSVVYLRQKQLDHRVLERIQKQIAAGV